MLKALTIQNYALIDALNIEFHKDFSIVTGETGAGKSILLGALSLVTGARADTSVLSNAGKKCFVEAVFDVKAYKLQHLFESLELDYEEETILRREIAVTGKSRAFINDTPVSLNQMKAIGSRLIDIHSQHQNLDLNNHLYQLQVLDTIASTNGLLSAYRQRYNDWKIAKKAIEDLKEEALQWQKDYEYNLFQFNQLSELKLDELNVGALEEEYKQLNNAEAIQYNLGAAFGVMSEGEINVLEQLKQVKQHLQQIHKVFPAAVELSERLESNIIDLKDMALDMENQAENIVHDPEKMEMIKDKLDGLYNQMQKHRAESIDELIALRNEYGVLVEKTDNFEGALKEAESRLGQIELELNTAAQNLSKNRTKHIPGFSKKVSGLLKELGMPNAVFEVKQMEKESFSAWGIDEIQFLFSANKNHPPQEISKIASGGEISRLMLSIKKELSLSAALPTIIFDEIDTGVSGDIAGKMAGIMQQMAQNMQVMSITHLPQIAASGKNHYRVFKGGAKAVTTKIELLTHEQRVQEIAKMLSGENITPEAISNAKALLN
jgi:DNA repair protein RecN (Recombination protein N)